MSFFSCATSCHAMPTVSETFPGLRFLSFSLSPTSHQLRNPANRDFFWLWLLLLTSPSAGRETAAAEAAAGNAGAVPRARRWRCARGPGSLLHGLSLLQLALGHLMLPGKLDCSFMACGAKGVLGSAVADTPLGCDARQRCC